MARLIRNSLITYTDEVSDADIRAALIMEAAEKHCLVQDGKIIPGVTSKVSFDGRRGSTGTYTVTLTRDPAKSGQALLPARQAILP